jgi:hypothetical protein
VLYYKSNNDNLGLKKLIDIGLPVKKVLVLVIMIFSCLGSVYSGDKLGLHFNPGYATYDMGGLQGINQLVIDNDQYGIPLVLTDDFPGGFYYQAGISYHPGEEVEYGLAYEYHSTHSEITDNSAESDYYLKNQITANSFIGNLDIIVNNERLFDFRVYSAIVVSFTELTNTERIKVSEIDTMVSRDLTAISYGLEVGLKVLYHFSFWSTGIKVGYLKDFGGHYKIGDADFYNPETLDPVQTDWDGFRISLTLILDPVALFKGSDEK